MAAPKTNKQQLVDDVDVKVGMNFRQLRKSKPTKEDKIFRLMQKIIKLREQTGQILQEFKKSFKPIKPDLTVAKRKPTPRKRAVPVDLTQARRINIKAAH